MVNAVLYSTGKDASVIDKAAEAGDDPGVDRQRTGDSSYTRRRFTITSCQTSAYLSGRRAPVPLGQHSIILLDDRGTCVRG